MRLIPILTVLWLATGCTGPGDAVDRAVQTARPVAGGGTPVVLEQAEDRAILQQIRDNMVRVPAGQFRMGDLQGVGEADEGPVRTVQVAAFALSRYEVTFEQYGLYVRATDDLAPEDRWGRGRRPVMDITWHDAMGFVEWLRQVTGVAFRLPTEAEWEYAARAGSVTRYAFGDDPAALCRHGNIADQSTDIGWRNRRCDDGFETTAPVGSFQPNAFGLYDMHGNVWEWLADCWFRDYGGAPSDSALRTRNGCSTRAQRGGSWASSPGEARAAYRSHGDEWDKSVTLGFRLAHDLE